MGRRGFHHRGHRACHAEGMEHSERPKRHDQRKGRGVMYSALSGVFPLRIAKVWGGGKLARIIHQHGRKHRYIMQRNSI